MRDHMERRTLERKTSLFLRGTPSNKGCFNGITISMKFGASISVIRNREKILFLMNETLRIDRVYNGKVIFTIKNIQIVFFF